MATTASSSDAGAAVVASKLSLFHILADTGARSSGLAADADTVLAHSPTKVAAPPHAPRTTTGRRRAMTAEEKRKARTCVVDGCTNYIVHRQRCFRHGVRTVKLPHCALKRAWCFDHIEALDDVGATQARSSAGCAGVTVRARIRESPVVCVERQCVKTLSVVLEFVAQGAPFCAQPKAAGLCWTHGRDLSLQQRSAQQSGTESSGDTASESPPRHRHSNTLPPSPFSSPLKASSQPCSPRGSRRCLFDGCWERHLPASEAHSTGFCALHVQHVTQHEYVFQL
ncbi:hypothetical protein PybrP1_010268 [[Pythium] brassicae (nom. inval.)]|nr:hypothetical protein PybrP1_010268 [[Pythium] brassicae (nom. inval.)]